MKKLIRLHAWGNCPSVYILTDNMQNAIKQINKLHPNKYNFSIANDQREQVQKNDLQLIFSSKLQNQIDI